MTTSNSSSNAPPNGGDPSMEDILASIRRILSDDEVAAATGAASPAAAAAIPEEDVFMLDSSMMIGTPSAAPEPAPAIHPEPASPPHDPRLLDPESEAAAAASVGTLLRTLTAERTTETHRGGPTIEDLVREGIRPLLKSWLDVHLPPLVERTVRKEIERIVGRANQ